MVEEIQQNIVTDDVTSCQHFTSSEITDSTKDKSSKDIIFHFFMNRNAFNNFFNKLKHN